MIYQKSPEWYAQRLGRVTASRVADVIARTRSGWGASRANYMTELLVERLTGTVAESYTSPAMQHGTDTEPLAKAAYEFYADAIVEEAPFFHHATLDAGASPDGLIGDVGLVEIKCPNTATHVDTLLGSSIPDKYQVQIAWQLACTDREWCDFVSYDPRLPHSMCLFVQRIERDDKRIAELERHVAEFLMELDEKIAALRHKFEGAEKPLKRQLVHSVLMAG